MKGGYLAYNFHIINLKLEVSDTDTLQQTTKHNKIKKAHEGHNTTTRVESAFFPLSQ